tara:strand:+ start:805 stop:1314 length:510 start_codon:yes stop_codon:yes gene_type:complete
MALSKIQAESMNLADTFAFTGTVTGTVTGTGAFAARGANNDWETYNENAIIEFDDDSTGDNFDTDNNYNTSTYKYTAPATGLYMFWYACYTANTSTVNGFSFLKNTAKVNFQHHSRNMFTWTNGHTHDHIQNGMCVLPLTSGDTMAVCAAYTTTDVYRGHSQWGGCRLA